MTGKEGGRTAPGHGQGRLADSGPGRAPELHHEILCGAPGGGPGRERQEEPLSPQRKNGLHLRSVTLSHPSAAPKPSMAPQHQPDRPTFSSHLPHLSHSPGLRPTSPSPVPNPLHTSRLPACALLSPLLDAPHHPLPSETQVPIKTRLKYHLLQEASSDFLRCQHRLSLLHSQETQLTSLSQGWFLSHQETVSH